MIVVVYQTEGRYGVMHKKIKEYFDYQFPDDYMRVKCEEFGIER
jgi:hypothetical protein